MKRTKNILLGAVMAIALFCSLGFYDMEYFTSNSDTTLRIIGFEAKEGRLLLLGDQDDDATDGWELAASTSGTLTIGNDSSTAGTFVDKLTIAGSTGNVTLTGDIVNEGGDTILMSTDDSYIFTSDDGHVTIQIQGNADAKSAILDLSADAAAQDIDTWTFTVADGGALTIANDDTATMTISEAMDITGTITLAEDEVLSNATDDEVSITSDSDHMTFAVRGHADAKSAILELSADAAADDIDTWLFTVADGGALTIANDDTATMTVSEKVVFSSSPTDTTYGFEVASTLATVIRSEGASGYFHTTVTGNLDGATYVTGTWMDIGAATPTANVMAAADFGLYESGGTLTSVGNMACINMGIYLDATNGPPNLSMFRLGANSNPATGTLPDYLFYADNKAAIAYSYDTGTSDTKQGVIKIYIKGGDVGTNTMYIRLYDGPG